ncbi:MULTISPECIES: hypothetical protein [Serratia]|jgi:hypothetical protein|uniref:hypothetical protein n=1 Tax=Serratia TaxID=613 RepID=UPI000965A892|nr:MULTISPECIES: hypothetical protein [Serratia]MCO7512590.1 hypothetical protein [Serratia fonticola]MDW5508591.1 hypothetical protein [Serratia proteamaculans]OKP16099.1 hypothetical protein BSQ35_23300 [Serratia liquefaciens]RYM83681.1 hypothetical protein BSR02_16975 [Serratia liquefaciens]WEO92464.1 hypothetical protein JET59_026905 [Serratia proteamaculans]
MAKPETDAIKALKDATMIGFGKVEEALTQLKETQSKHARATYQGMTSSGKSRYVAALVAEVGSQAEVSRMLNLTPGRINQLVKSEKNRKNGK